MTHLGMSGAAITVLKRGPGCREQGEFCQDLGPRVAPRVLELLDDGYEMEYLHGHAPSHELTWELSKIVSLLLQHVWDRSTEHDTTWLPLLLGWSTIHAPALTKYIEAIYRNLCGPLDSNYCVIHGDPTVANMRIRPTGEIVLCDPLRHGGKIPPRAEVDLGKVLQSAVGWEAACLSPVHCPPIGQEFASVDKILRMFSPWTRRAAWTWCAIHLMRAVPYAQTRGKPALARWASDTCMHVVEQRLR